MGEVISIIARSAVPVSRPERVRLPPDIQVSIDNWRLQGCWAALPGDYLEWHYKLASEELDRISKRYRLEVVDDPRVVDENCFRAFIAEVVTHKQLRISLQWDDTRQAFMKRQPVDEHIHYEPLLERDLA